MKTSEIVEDYQRGSLQRVISRRCELEIITHGGKSHVVFGHSYEGECVTYCGLRWWNGHSPTRKQKHCKNCTRELRKAGMSWRWFEVQQFEAANGRDERPGGDKPAL